MERCLDQGAENESVNVPERGLVDGSGMGCEGGAAAHVGNTFKVGTDDPVAGTQAVARTGWRHLEVKTNYMKAPAAALRKSHTRHFS